ncbi:uncharacterized protein LOC122620157 [Drosophila teissieri]|uniref:uncharacterized protein LOC122620157 n=1 Tax=Drosophila teissieri TaxID=7243 RepID=UPI001CBA4936|nr:uncharacterized protein LOC122620157 [Drosophila teissieri]
MITLTGCSRSSSDRKMHEERSHPKPLHLSADYVQDKLRAYFKADSLKLEKLDIKPAILKGENYASMMTRINVEYTTEKSEEKQATKFMIKTIFAEKNPAANVFIKYGIYTREMDMYQRILPKIADLVKREIQDPRRVCAGTVYVDKDRDSIIFEDLALEHYKVACRIKKLDLAHTHLVLERLANFHDAGAALAERELGIFKNNYDRGFYNRHTRGYEPIMKSLLKTLSRSLNLDQELRQRYQAKIDRLVDHIMVYGERSTTNNPGDFQTLNHGDLWTTNLMFQYDAKGQPINAVFIDFQFSVWNSPAIDLHYFFSTSIQDELRLNNQPELVQFYYYKLKDALKKVKYAGCIPTLFDFQQQFRTRAFYAVFASLIFEPFMVYDGEDEVSLEHVISEGKGGMRFKDDVYQQECVRQRLHHTLPYLDQWGLLDDI